MQIRIGSGFDVHAFGIGDHFVLCGVKIPYHQGLLAHSDGDVGLHALTDALLGAIAMGDIGELFPDTDLQYQGADSRHLLKIVYEQVLAQGWRVSNIDITILAQAPKLKIYKLAMRENIANDLQLILDQVNVKATTTEKLGFIGRAEGIACQASVLLIK